MTASLRAKVEVIAAGLAAAATLGLSAGASATPNANLDAFATPDPARTLVLCDTTAFVATKPDLNANRIFAIRDSEPAELMLPPYFVQGGTLYLRSSERMYQRLRREGVSRNRIAQIQGEVGREMVKAYERRQIAPAFLRDQNRACRQWVRSHGVFPG
ncbi:MAG: hypothetical protein ACXW3D_01710 [Caulobacteraceae bacterium]